MTDVPDRKGWIHLIARTPTRTEALLALAVVVCSVGSFAYRDASTARSPTAGVGHLMTLYASVAAELPIGARVGFVSLLADRAASGAARFIAQNALAPRLLDSDLTAVSFVVTTPAAPRGELDDDPRLAGFELLRTSAGGIRIYRRRQ